jgi:hypothetical protein
MEATMWGGAITRLQLQQTISRLRKLDELAEVPSENLAVPEVDQTRDLSISREKEIASNLAFLSLGAQLIDPSRFILFFSANMDQSPADRPPSSNMNYELD